MSKNYENAKKDGFKAYLESENLSANTIRAYLAAAECFEKRYGEVTRDTLLAYKGYLTENYTVQTANLRIHAINKYLVFLNKQSLHLKSLKVQQKNFIENVISNADYNYLKNCLRRDGEIEWYFVIRYLAATGARVGELVQFKAEHIRLGYIDLYAKGGKMRRLYIPAALCRETDEWLAASGRTSGYLFLNSSGKRITPRGIADRLKFFADKYGIDRDVIYPHSFRHRYAKNFLEKFSDIALLADLMGHESIETTRIYLRRTSLEQQEIVNKIVTW